VDRYDVVISTRSMAGIDQLLEAISDSVVSTVKVDTVLTVQQRQKALLSDCVRSLRRCEDLKLQPELAAEQLRLATGCIGRLTGDVDVEELLGVIFSRFCIGK
jgi:tRNA modification GTPase